MSAPHPAAIAARLAFTRPEDVILDDPDRRLARARTLDVATMADPAAYDQRLCPVHDLAARPELRPSLRVHGFDRADLSQRPGVQAALSRVRAAGRLDEADARAIRRGLVGRVVPLAGGDRLWILVLAREGFFLRCAGPGGLRIGGGHDAAVSVHADQDVEGTPLRQLLGGAAPWLFRHESPARHNHRSPLVLVNLWIPLAQVTRPLALMDARTLDRRTQQLRYGLPTDTFLRRRDGMRVNDIWAFRHHDDQRWYFDSTIDARSAHVFDTLSTPHASFILPGEERAAAGYRRLSAALDALAQGGPAAAARALAAARPEDAEGPAPATLPLAQAIAAIEARIAEGSAILSPQASPAAIAAWRAGAREDADRVVRRSIEMRAVGLLLRGRGARAGA